MIKKQIKKIKIRFTLSHILIGFVFLVFLSVAYIYYSYKSTVDNIKKALIELSYEVDNAMMFDETENIDTGNFFAAVIDTKKRTVFGSLPVRIDSIKNGFLYKNGYLFFISNSKSRLSVPYRIVTACSLKNIRSLITKRAKLYFLFSLIISLLYGLFIYFLSVIWLKPVVRSYANLEEFSEMFSHEVMTPVSTALFYIEDKGVRESLIKSRDFLNSFLTFQKQQTFPWHKSSVNLKNTADIIIKELIFLIEDKYIDIKSDWKVEKINSNPELIYLILKNIMENAIKYSPKNSEIKIRTDIKNRRVHINITNKNAGSREQPEKFKSKKGFGLGLYITKKAVETLRGEIKIEAKENMSIDIYLP